MPAPQRIHQLVEKFEQNFKYHQSGDYNEEQLRTEFLNPFFEVLGWDMENKHAKGADRDVHYEKLIHGKAPDFGFYLDKKLRFFVEAKKPSLNVCNNQDAALQLRGYGWSAKTARSILTDFEELSIYDTSVRPKTTDAAKIARIDCIKFTEYVERWDEIEALFSREAVLGGSLEKLTKKRAQQTVDDELLDDISKWRDLLAHNIANRNKVSEERLNRIVQDSIARILFLRICEDRGIAHEGELSKVVEGEGAYAKLYKLFKKAEQRYDSDLFEVASIADLKIDDKVLKEMISELYFPKSPYKFDAIPAEILGQVYEQFLGKVIRLTEGGRAKVEVKPEVRKAGGIYYTPTYIVEYIVKNTVGKLVEGKTPKQIETLSIVDPACGSGSFLLGAYKFLADWYRDWYVADNAEKHKKASKIYRDKSEQWQLTLEEKKRILTAHIYGVDLDRQAVEMAKLSLMLEALSSPEQQSLFNERMLPRLGDNIKCGNSLVGTEYFLEQLSADPRELTRVNPFDWKSEFSNIFAHGGFNAVIGNPPYLKELNSKDTFRDIRKGDYKIYYQGKMDMWYFFLHRAFDIAGIDGKIGFITNSYFLKNQGASKLVDRIRLDAVMNEYIDFAGQRIFKGVSGKHAIHIYEKHASEKSDMVKVCDASGVTNIGFALNNCKFVEYQKIFSKDSKISFDEQLIDFSQYRELNDFFEVSQGVVEATDKVSKKNALDSVPAGTGVFVLSGSEVKALGLKKEELAVLRKYLDPNNVIRYGTSFKEKYLIYSDSMVRDRIKSGELPALKKHLDRVARFITSSNKPYGIHRPREARFFEVPKLICKAMFSRPQFTFDDQSFFVGFSFSVVISRDKGFSLKFLLGLMNSRLGDIGSIKTVKKGGRTWI